MRRSFPCPRTKGLTHREIAAHLAEVYGAEVSEQTITATTDRVIEGMADWQSRPWIPFYVVIFIDAIRAGNAVAGTVPVLAWR